MRLFRSCSAVRAAAQTAALSLGLLVLVCAEASADTPAPADQAAAAAKTVPATPDHFTAITTDMTPAGVSLRIDLRGWSDEPGRTAALKALTSDSDVHKALMNLPTLGYVWRSDSSVGYSVKYAHRAATSRGERVTVVIDRRIGSYDFKPWSAQTTVSNPDLEYSVIELYLDDQGKGDGTLSLAAPVKLDAANAIVSLADEGLRHVLGNAEHEPKPERPEAD